MSSWVLSQEEPCTDHVPSVERRRGCASRARGPCGQGNEQQQRTVFWRRLHLEHLEMALELSELNTLDVAPKLHERALHTAEQALLLHMDLCHETSFA